MQGVLKAAATLALDDLGHEEFAVRRKRRPYHLVAIKSTFDGAVLERREQWCFVRLRPTYTHKAACTVICWRLGACELSVLDRTFLKKQCALCGLETVKILVKQDGNRVPQERSCFTNRQQNMFAIKALAHAVWCLQAFVCQVFLQQQPVWLQISAQHG